MSGQVVLGVGASHSTLMNTHWDATVDRAGATRFRDALASARDAIAAAAPDTVVIVGSNHFRGLWLDLLPAFTLGVGEVEASGESGTPAGPQRTDRDLARHLAAELVERHGFDPAFSARLQIDHGQSHAIQYLLAGLDVAVIPLVVNVFAPPLPTPRRCAALGTAIAQAVAAYPAPRRVAVIASGGLSHRLPWPDWRAPDGADDEFMVRAWLDGRGEWRRFDARRREIIRSAQPVINAEFDTGFLDAVAGGDLGRYADWTAARIETVAGNGGQEIRTWLTMAAALGYVKGRVLAYEPMPEWLTGMAVAVLDPAQEAGDRTT